MTTDIPVSALVLFDCDGTLVDSQHAIVEAMCAAYETCGVVPPTREEILSVVGLSLPETFAVLSNGVADFPVGALEAAYRMTYRAQREAAPPEPLYPGARETLEALLARADLQLGMVTGKARRGVRRVLTGHAMEGWFSTIQTADDAPSKPHPGMVLQAMAEAGAVPACTVVVGDTTYDMQMAKAAGAFAIGVCWGYHDRAALTEAGADLMVERFEDLPPAIETLFGRLPAPSPAA
ncbi:HAD-IA family hydrolase [Xanthobacter sp. DSM 24535]|uniref:HAD-IA family hydrolase n=1 Tax=Roseixanthobacter psychrophilus TaxID=3119917 RepID=UPI0037266CF1